MGEDSGEILKSNAARVTPEEESKLSLEKNGQFKPIETKPAVVSRDTVSDAYVFDAELPIVGGSVYSPEGSRVFARVMCRERVQGDEQRPPFYRIWRSDRSEFLHPFLFRIKDKLGSVFSFIQIKGGGSNKALEETGSPYKIRESGEIEGAATIGDIRLDARNSRKLHEAGIKTRIALGVFKLEEVEAYGKKWEPDKFAFPKKPEDLPGIGVFAVRTALRVENIEIEFRNGKFESEESSQLLRHLIIISGNDDSPEFKKFHERFRDTLEDAQPMTIDNRLQILSEYMAALSGVLGRQAARFEKIRAAKRVHTELGYIFGDTGHNVSCLGESVDNSEVIFGARVSEIASFQNALVDYVLAAIPRGLFYNEHSGVDNKDLLVRVMIGTRIKSRESYLDEMLPDWRTRKVPDGFLGEEGKTLQLNEIQLREAFFVTQIKYDRLRAEKGLLGRITAEELSEVSGCFLGSLFKAEQRYTFFDQYLKRFGKKFL